MRTARYRVQDFGIGHNEDGAVAVLFSLGIVVTLGFLGAALDYSNAVRLQGGIQASLDAAVLSAARKIAAEGADSSAQASDTVNLHFQENFKQKSSSGANGVPSVKASMSNSDKLTATATLKMPTTLLKLLGIKDLNLTANSVVQIGAGKSDIALVLDNTASMSGAKLDGLRDAATRLLDAVYKYPGATNSVRVGIVPFAEYVNVGTKYAGASWLAATNTTSRDSNYCVDAVSPIYGTPCQTVTATGYNDGAPYTYTYQSCPVIGQKTEKICQSFTETSRWEGCVGSRNVPLDHSPAVVAPNVVPAMFQGYVTYNGGPEQINGAKVNCNSPLTRLTNEKSALTSAIAGMTAVGETYIPAGLLWGWRLLSDQPPFADGPKANDVDPAKKIMVLMTDGANTRSQNHSTSPWHDGTDQSLANSTSSTLCSGIKGDNTILYVISFALPDTNANSMLQACASSKDHFFMANSTTDLVKVFEDIGSAISIARLTN